MVSIKSLTTGLPSVLFLHLIVLVLTVFYLSKHQFLFDAKDRYDITKQVSTSNYISSTYLFWIRFLMACIVWLSSTYVYLDKEGLTITLSKRNGELKTLHILNASRFTMFTMICWLLQGIYFTLSAYCSFAFSFNYTVPDTLLMLTWIFYEMSFATAYLVTIVVTFVLIPAHRKKGLPLDNFFKITALTFHNGNVLMMMTETLLNSLTFKFSHFPFIVLFGQIYVLYSWYLYSKLEVFYYFFLDYELEYAVFWQLGLLFAVSLFTHNIIWNIDHIIYDYAYVIRNLADIMHVCMYV